MLGYIVLIGNKGEWSEIYTFLKLIGEGKVYAGDQNLNKIQDLFYPIIMILRWEKKGSYNYGIKAAVKLNNEMLRFYWELGKDIEEKQADNKYGSKSYATLSRDLPHDLPNVEGLSDTSIRYAKRFYISEKANLPQLVERLQSDLFSVPWGHHRYIIDKCSNDSEKVQGTMPSIKEIEAKLDGQTNS